MSTFGTILTGRGEALIANHLLMGRKLDITEIAVGDGGGSAYQPTQSMTALRREVWRGAVNTVEISEASPNVIVIRALIPQNVGGFTIREAGVFDAAGNLIGVTNTPQTEKVANLDGASTEQYIEMLLAVSSAEAINLEVDPSMIMASRRDIERHNDDPEAHGGSSAALEAAGEAQEAANKAKEAADEAKVAADKAKEAADEAKGIAEEGKGLAESNKEQLTKHNADETAHSDIRTVLSGKAAQSAVTAAQSTADAAKAVAEIAQTTANAALPRAGGNMTGNLVASDPDVGTMAVRNIYAGTADMTAGSTGLVTGAIYFVYE